MNECEATGRTLDEAVEKALTSLGIKKENAVIEIKEEPNQGLLGLLGSKSARVVVKPEKGPEEYVKTYTEELIKHMGIEGQVIVNEDNQKIKVEIYGQDVGSLIGRRGKTLSDMQYLISVVIRRQFYELKKMIVLDVENYRERREKTLVQLAKSVAKKVKEEGIEKELEPMTPQERRVIHLALQDYPGVTTTSRGEEPSRKVVIVPR